jgi:hypothetical protein
MFRAQDIIWVMQAGVGCQPSWIGEAPEGKERQACLPVPFGWCANAAQAITPTERWQRGGNACQTLCTLDCSAPTFVRMRYELHLHGTSSLGASGVPGGSDASHTRTRRPPSRREVAAGSAQPHAFEKFKFTFRFFECVDCFVAKLPRIRTVFPLRFPAQRVDRRVESRSRSGLRDNRHNRLYL